MTAFSPIVLTNVDGALYVNGQPSSGGAAGPALFTLIADQGTPQLPTPNSIQSTSNNTTSVRSVESYYTAFLTFKLETLPTGNTGDLAMFGLVSNTHTSTFAFNLMFNSGVTYISYNGGGAQSFNIPIAAGDIISICVTESTFQFFVNGAMSFNGTTDVSFLNLFADFYANCPYSITNIAFGFLPSPIIVYG